MARCHCNGKQLLASSHLYGADVFGTNGVYAAASAPYILGRGGKVVCLVVRESFPGEPALDGHALETLHSTSVQLWTPRTCFASM